jgi:outer membrane lipoprotein-sorting protein
VSRILKTLPAFSAAALLLLASACAQNQKVVTETPVNDTVVSATPPFQTKEPERYRATRTITTVTAADIEEITKTSIMRNGELRREETDNGLQRVVYLNRPEGRFVLLLDERVFADTTNVEHLESGDESESSPDRLLHTEPISTSYQRLGAETVNGRNTQKYRVVVNSSPGANVSGSESVVWVDETLQMPIKSELKAADGTRWTMELTDIVLEVDSRVFQIPGDFKKVTFSELRARFKKDDASGNQP